MTRNSQTLPWLAPALLLLMANVGCSGANLGDFDDSNDSREEMPGPGIFTDESGDSALTWSSDSKEPASTANSAAVTASATSSAASPEQAEFEQFKAWNELRTDGAESAEYQEFLQWLEYQKFKSNQ